MNAVDDYPTRTQVGTGNTAVDLVELYGALAWALAAKAHEKFHLGFSKK